MSLSALRRSAIAASTVLAIGGSLAAASSASAITFPWTGSSDSTAPATGSPYTSITQVNNVSAQALVGGEQLLNGIHDTNFPTAFTAASSLTAANVATIAADFAETTGTNCAGGTACGTDLSALWTTDHFNAATGVSTYAAFNADVQSAAVGWPQTAELINDLEPFGTTLASLDGDLEISSTATVTHTGIGSLYTTTLATDSAAGGAAVIPSGLAITFPTTLGLNTGPLIARLLTAPSATPPAADAIGTATLDSPLAALAGGSNGVASGNVFDGSQQVNGKTQYFFEIDFPSSGVYELGTLASLSFPLTVTFTDAVVPQALATQEGLSSDTTTIPFTSLNLSFNNTSTSPVEPKSCSSLGGVTATGSDELAPLAALFGDTSDSSATVPITSTATVVTDKCAPTSSKGKITVKKNTATLSLTVKGDGDKIKGVTIKLPSGIRYKNKTSYTASFNATASKTITLKGIKETAKAKKAKKDTVTFTVKYKESTGATVASESAKGTLRA